MPAGQSFSQVSAALLHGLPLPIRLLRQTHVVRSSRHVSSTLHRMLVNRPALTCALESSPCRALAEIALDRLGGLQHQGEVRLQPADVRHRGDRGERQRPDDPD